MNPFYQIPKALQWIIAIIMAGLGCIFLLHWIVFSKNQPLGYILIFLIVPMIQFLATPMFKLTGVFKYLSPMVLIFGASDYKYDIHNGTSFDYLMLMHSTKPGLPWRQKILSHYMEAFLAIIQEIENADLPKTVEVRGSSYFFSERTASRLGFRFNKTPLFERLNIIVNIFDLFWMYSLAYGKLKIPNVVKVKTITMTGTELVDNKEKIQSLYRFLKRNQEIVITSSQPAN